MLQISFHHQYSTLIHSFIHKTITDDNCYELKVNPQLYKFYNFTKVHIQCNSSYRSVFMFFFCFLFIYFFSVILIKFSARIWLFTLTVLFHIVFTRTLIRFSRCIWWHGPFLWDRCNFCRSALTRFGGLESNNYCCEVITT